MAFDNQVTGSMGTKIYASATLPAENSEAAWKTLDTDPVFKKIGGVTDGSAYGGTYELGSEAQLEDGVLMKWKGVMNAGSASLAVLVLEGDPGQAVLEEFAGKRTPCGFKYVYNNGDVDYFAALVMAWDKQVGGANDAVKASPTLELIAPAIRIKKS